MTEQRVNRRKRQTKLKFYWPLNDNKSGFPRVTKKSQKLAMQLSFLARPICYRFVMFGYASTKICLRAQSVIRVGIAQQRVGTCVRCWRWCIWTGSIWHNTWHVGKRHSTVVTLFGRNEKQKHCTIMLIYKKKTLPPRPCLY